MENIGIAKELKSRIAIDAESFNRLGIRLASVNIRPTKLEGDTDFTVLVEVESLNGGQIEKSASVKLNLYDAGGDLYAVYGYSVLKNFFTGYVAGEVDVCLDGRALQMVRGIRAYGAIF